MRGLRVSVILNHIPQPRRRPWSSTINAGAGLLAEMGPEAEHWPVG